MSEHRQSDGAIHETTTEARGGSTPHVTRYVLGVGTLLVVVIFVIIFSFGLV